MIPDKTHRSSSSKFVSQNKTSVITKVQVFQVFIFTRNGLQLFGCGSRGGGRGGGKESGLQLFLLLMYRKVAHLLNIAVIM